MISNGAALDPRYPLTTHRLRLRPLDPVNDLDAFHAYRSMPEVCRYAPIEPVTRTELAKRLAHPDRTRSTLEKEGDALVLAIEHAATSQMIGDLVLFWRSAEHRQGEIGYTINPEHQGQGYATEAAAAVLELGFVGLGLHRITARIDERHGASLAIARKLGMRLESRSVDCQWLKEEWITLTEWALLDSEWRGPRVLGAS